MGGGMVAEGDHQRGAAARDLGGWGAALAAGFAVGWAWRLAGGDEGEEPDDAAADARDAVAEQDVQGGEEVGAAQEVAQDDAEHVRDLTRRGGGAGLVSRCVALSVLYSNADVA